MADTKTTAAASSIKGNLLLGGGICALLIPPLIWALPPEQSDGKWVLAAGLLILGMAAPFVRDHGRRFLYWRDGDT